MKKQARPWSLFRNALSGLLLCAGLMSPSQTNAVTVTSATFTESTMPGIFSDWYNVRSLNTDMHQIFNGGNVTLLTATVVEGDRIAFSPDASLHIECFGTNPYSATYSLPFGATGLDIAISTNMSPAYNQDFNFIVNVVYESGGSIWMQSYAVNDAGLTTVSSSLLNTKQLSATGPLCRNPHIDMNANSLFNTYSGNYYALNQFAVVWEQDLFLPDPKGIYGIIGYWASVSPGTPTSFESSPILIDAGDYSYPDVACLGYITPPSIPTGASRRIYVSYLDNSNSDVRLATFEADKTIVVVGGMSSSVIAPGSSALEWHYNPRIESIVAADLPGFTQEIWQIVCESDPGTGFREVRAYDNMTAPTVPAAVYNLGSVVSFTGNHSMPVVSGVGEGCHPGARNIFSHNKHFTTSYYSEYTNIGGGGGSNEGDYFANAIYQLTGLPAPSGPYPNYYEINYNPLQSSFASRTSTPPIIATTSSSNTGYELFSVWHEGWDGTNSTTSGAIKYKFNGDAYAYKNGTTGINNINAERDYIIYPSPATTAINVKGVVNAQYRIMDAIGKTISTGTISSNANSINVSRLAAGNYSITLTENEHTQSVRFVKQ